MTISIKFHLKISNKMKLRVFFTPSRVHTLVEYVLALHKSSPRMPQDKERLGREIESTDRAIDRLIYELYGLSEEEVKIVEGG